jgi:hypothetical protein
VRANDVWTSNFKKYANCELTSKQKENRDVGLLGCDAVVPDVSKALSLLRGPCTPGSWKHESTMRDVRLLPRSSREQRSSELLRSE